MEKVFRCDCPVTTALDLLGDKWMLVIIKQMLIQGMQTFKDFNESDEGISTSILTSKLKELEEFRLIERKNHPTNKKTKLYLLTEKGLSLASIIVDLAIWSDEHMREYHPKMNHSMQLVLIKSNKRLSIQTLIDNYKKHNLM